MGDLARRRVAELPDPRGVQMGSESVYAGGLTLFGEAIAGVCLRISVDFAPHRVKSNFREYVRTGPGWRLLLKDLEPLSICGRLIVDCEQHPGAGVWLPSLF